MTRDSTRASQTEPPIISLSTSLLGNFNNDPTSGLDLGILFQSVSNRDVATEPTWMCSRRF